MYFLRLIGKVIKFICKLLNTIRLIILNVVFFVILLYIVGLAAQFGEMNTPPSQSGVLVLDIEGIIVDSTPYNQDVYKLTKRLNKNKVDLKRENSLFELSQKIEQATNDPNIKAIILKLDNLVSADLPSLQYLGKYLTKFKQGNKPIYAIGSQYNQQQYYLASFANKIYLTNQGSTSLYGFTAQNLYFKTLLDNLKVNTHVFKVGTYKSAVEPFTRDSMSEQAKQNTRHWLNMMWNNYLTDISAQREQPSDSLVPEPNTYLARLKSVSGSMSDYALENGIIDDVVSLYNFNQEVNYNFDNPKQLSIYDYVLTSDENEITAFSNTASTTSDKPSIAVIFINGAINTGDSANNIAGSDSISNQINNIIKNKNVKAAVVRINSPGGSVYASEMIRNQLQALRHKGVPVVVSMGGMAASGGYWIATESDKIIANKNTITGSIGIFGIIPTFENSLSEIGIYTDGVSTSPLAGGSLTKDLPDEVNQMIQMNIENGYDTFINLVADSRSMTTKDVEKIAQGQVWLGQEAKKLRLVDQIGDFDDAIKAAADLAEISDYTIDWPKASDNLFDALFAEYSVYLPQSAVEMIYNQLPMSKQLKQHIALWDNLADPQNRYAFCLNCSNAN